MNAEEFLKGLNEHDPVFEIDTEYEFTEEQLINFAERYHERKLKILRLQNVSQQRELLLQAYKDGFQAAVDSLVGANEAVKNKTLQ